MMAEKKPTGAVLVAGAGIAGIKAAIELAESGYKVILTDASPQMGGILAKLDSGRLLRKISTLVRT